MADLCALGANLRTTPPEDITAVPVSMTVFDGRVVYEGAAG
ncbi:hypothetical protein AB0F42_09770 [Streptomyces buecherae]